MHDTNTWTKPAAIPQELRHRHPTFHPGGDTRDRHPARHERPHRPRHPSRQHGRGLAPWHRPARPCRSRIWSGRRRRLDGRTRLGGIRRQPARRYVRQRADLLFWQHRQVLYRLDRHTPHHRCHQRAERLHDDHPHGRARPRDARVLLDCVVYHQPTDLVCVPSRDPHPRHRTRTHHVARKQHLQPRFRYLRHAQQRGAGKCRRHPRGQVVQPRGARDWQVRPYQPTHLRGLRPRRAPHRTQYAAHAGLHVRMHDTHLVARR